MHIFSNNKRFKILLIVVIGMALIVLIIKAVFYPIAPKLAPMEHFKTKRGQGCFALALERCQTSYYYVAEGSMSTVINQVYESLSKNDSYTVDRRGENALYVTYRNADPNERDVTKKGFGIDFMTPPGPSDKYWGFFMPTDACPVGSTHCVEALLIK